MCFFEMKWWISTCKCLGYWTRPQNSFISEISYILSTIQTAVIFKTLLDDVKCYVFLFIFQTESFWSSSQSWSYQTQSCLGSHRVTDESGEFPLSIISRTSEGNMTISFKAINKELWEILVTLVTMIIFCICLQIYIW